MTQGYQVRIIDAEPPVDGNEQVLELENAIGALLEGRHPAVVGGVLAQLHAILIAGMAAYTDDQQGMIRALLNAHEEAIKESLDDLMAEMRESAKAGAQ